MLLLGTATRFGCNAGASGARSTACKSPGGPLKSVIRNFSRPPRQQPSQSTRSAAPTLRQRLLGPPTKNAYAMGKGAVAGASAIALGAMCYYASTTSTAPTILSNEMTWPDYVRQRVHDTYMYFGGACLISAVSALYVFQTPSLLRLVTRNGFLSIMATFVVMVGSAALADSLPYTPGLGAKQIAWAVHCAIMGAVIAPICFIGGPILTRAALYTAGMIGGLSTVAMCAPSDRFLFLGGPLAIGLGLVLAASLASIFLPPTTMVGAGLASFSLYGGLIVFGGFMLYDTQRIVRMAEEYPVDYPTPYDPIAASMAIYMDALNIFIRIAMILASSGGDNTKGKGKR